MSAHSRYQSSCSLAVFLTFLVEQISVPSGAHGMDLTLISDVCAVIIRYHLRCADRCRGHRRRSFLLLSVI